MSTSCCARCLPFVSAALLLLAPHASAQIVEDARLLATDPADFDDLGDAVAIDGATIVLGRPDDDTGDINAHGSAFVYVQPEGGWSGTMTESAELVPPSLTKDGRFGMAVAVQGDTVVVGEPGYSPNARGALHVYRRPAGGWSGIVSPVATLATDTTHVGAWMGAAVAIDGDTIVAGAPFDLAGAAFVFVEPPGGWSGLVGESARLTFSASAFVAFGNSVGVSGTQIVVGAPGYYAPTNPRGKAYVFRRPTGGWQGAVSPSSVLTASNGGPDDTFGMSVSIDGDKLVVGAPRLDRAYVFVQTPGWTQQSRLSASGPIDDFGASVAIDGPIVVVGSPDPGFGGVGATHVFREPAGGWSGPEKPSAKLVTSLPSSATSNYLGQAVAIDGTVVLSGVPSLDEGSVTSAGGAMIHLLEPAAAAFRNAGTNPASLTASAATLGGALDATVDLTTTGHATAILFAFDTPATLPLAGGQTLLAVDGGSGELLTGAGLLAPGPLATFSLPIPSTPALYSRGLSVQALHAFGATPFALSNAYDLTIGF